MGAAESNMSGGASSRGWSGSSYTTSSDQPGVTPPQLMRRMSKSARDAEPSSPKLSPEDVQPTGRIPSPPKMARAVSAPASSSSASIGDIQQPGDEDHFTPGDQRRGSWQAHTTWMTHPHLKSGKGDHIAQPTAASAPLAQNVQSFSKRLLGLASGGSSGPAQAQGQGEAAAGDGGKPFLSSTLAPSSFSARMPTRRMSTGSLPPTSDAAEGAAGAPPSRRRASFSAEAADRFAGGFPW